MPTRTRTLAAASALACAALLAAGLAPAAEAAGSSLQGTVTWTRTVTTNKDTGGDLKTGTETTTVTMKVKMTRRAGAAYWQVEDNGSSYTGKYTLASTLQERDSGGNVNCTTTHAGTATASGKLPKKPKSTSPPALFSTIVPGTSSLSAKTKQIVLTPILAYKGNDTTTYVGGGISPCDGGSFTDPINGSLSAGNDARQVCYPAGSSAKAQTPTANDVVGAWNKKKKAFVFDCSKTYDDGNGATVTTTIAGTLKLK